MSRAEFGRTAYARSQDRAGPLWHATGKGPSANAKGAGASTDGAGQTWSYDGMSDNVLYFHNTTKTIDVDDDDYWSRTLTLSVQFDEAVDRDTGFDPDVDIEDYD